MNLIPKNHTARTVLDHLPTWHVALGGYHGGQTYCIGVLVQDAAEAFNLGKTMGAEAIAFGTVGHDKQNNRMLVVFRDALVSQGTAQS